MPRHCSLAFSILVVGLCAPLFSLPALAVSSSASASACKAIDDAYRKQMLSGRHFKLARTSTGAMTGRQAMIYGAGDGTTCTDVRSEATNGEAAEVYRQIHKNGDETYDTLIWVSKGSGVPLRQEQDADLGKGQKGHETLLYQYSK
jgi:hypothetical protein